MHLHVLTPSFPTRRASDLALQPSVQADARVGRLLARRPEERDAEPHLRHRLAQPEAARRAPPPDGGGRQARPSQAGRRDGPVPPSAGGARQRLLAPARLYHLARAGGVYAPRDRRCGRSEEHTSELQSLMRISYAVFCLKKKKPIEIKTTTSHN